MDKIMIKGRKYGVEKTEKGTYILSGERGAVYGCVRMAYDPSLMFLVSLKGNGLKVDPLGQVFLTDRNGKLEELGLVIK